MGFPSIDIDILCPNDVRTRVGSCRVNPGSVATFRHFNSEGVEFLINLYCLEKTPTGPDSEVFDLRFSVETVGQETAQASFRFCTSIAETLPPWWLIPGLFYGDNRLKECSRLFPAFAVGSPNRSDIVSNHWSFRSDRAATPAVFAFGSATAIAMTAPHWSSFGQTGLGFGYHDSLARIHLDFPFCEEPWSYVGDDTVDDSRPQYCDIEPQESFTASFRLHVLPADRQMSASILRDQWENQPKENSMGSRVEWVDAEQATDLAADCLQKWHYDPSRRILLETVAFDRELQVQGKHPDRIAMHVGWLSGIPWAYALLRHGLRRNCTSQIEAAKDIISNICQNLAPCHTFWGTWYEDRGWSESWTKYDEGLHSRTLGEACLYLGKAIRRLGPDAPELWRTALRKNLEVVAGRQRCDGNLGSVHHALTGEVLSWQGAAGMAWIPALALGDELRIGNYLECALHAGEFYARFVDDYFIYGSTEDVDLAPSSEDGYVAVEAYVALCRATPSPTWVRRAVMAAEWALSFRYSYDVRFDPHTLLGKYQFRTRGADQASPCNQHLHSYGLIMTDSLLELSSITGDSYYRDRALESADCFRQFIARHDGDFNAYKGMVSERFYQTDCFQAKGMLLTLSHAWCVGVTLLANEILLDPH